MPTRLVDHTSVPTRLVDHTSVPTRLVDQATLPTKLVDHTSVPIRLVDHTSVPTRLVDHTSVPTKLVDHISMPTRLVDHTSVALSDDEYNDKNFLFTVEVVDSVKFYFIIRNHILTCCGNYTLSRRGYTPVTQIAKSMILAWFSPQTRRAWPVICRGATTKPYFSIQQTMKSLGVTQSTKGCSRLAEAVSMPVGIAKAEVVVVVAVVTAPVEATEAVAIVQLPLAPPS